MSARKNPMGTVFVNERRNNLQLYHMYPKLHHTEGTRLARALWKELQHFKVVARYQSKSQIKRGR
eukprot:9477708-Pyramimonas_sp.AAC.1